ncbi:TIGR04376 family protein [Nodosilinea sp. LEGE 07088]|uniref:TIGR04376 family protein n=1 Tax=Nodosilinea sp. LEGE 07088 TaxID=2777968 RepID=UPI001882FB2F|nr:TIGR04376 family protein [Nodosilinea sp. LEGE 07088]MBE9139328.1 TIGR04376 family protein [Nodosilinea sp. LEGE 07088]
MGLFEDLSRFLETRLDEFLKANPHLELWGLEDQLRGQEQDAIRLLGDLKRREKQLEDSILATAQDIQRWHGRITKAQAANRLDLAQAAEEREAALLRQGNQYWGQMKGIKEQIEQTRTLQKEIHDRRRELKTKIAATQAQRTAQRASTSWDTGWAQPPFDGFGKDPMDPVEESFQRWETEQELEELKRQVGK